MTPPSNSFCFAPMFNHPPHKDEKGVVHASYDATGAFHPYMAAYEKLYSKTGTVTTLKFNNHAHASDEFDAIMGQINHAVSVADAQLDAVVYFGHGWPTGLVSADIYTGKLVDFANLIRANCVPGVTIVLYACLCGQRNTHGGCFAARLANELTDMQATVYAHENAGHTTTNPYVYRFSGNQPPVAVAPPGKLRAFTKLLKTESIDAKPRGNTAFWARMPFMTDDEIDSEVSGYA